MEFKARPYSAELLFTLFVSSTSLLVFIIKKLFFEDTSAPYLVRYAIYLIMLVMALVLGVGMMTSKFTITKQEYIFQNIFRKQILKKKEVTKICEGNIKTCEKPEPGKKPTKEFGINILANKKVLFIKRFSFKNCYEDIAKALKVKIDKKAYKKSIDDSISLELRKKIRTTRIVAFCIYLPLLIAFLLYNPAPATNLIFGKTKLWAIIGFTGVYSMIVGRLVNTIQTEEQKKQK